MNDTDLEDLVADTALVVRRLQRSLPLLAELADTRQAGRPFIPQATLAVMGEQYTKDKRAHRQAQAAGLPTGGGASPAPGNMPGWILSAETEQTLWHLISRITLHHRRHQHGPEVFADLHGPRATHESTTTVKAGWLYELLWTIDSSGLVRAVASDLNNLIGRIELFLDGEPRRQLDAECPWCGNRSLVVYLHSQVIFCERHRDTQGRRPVCHCHRTECPCRTDPAFRHSWLQHSKPGAVNSWDTLLTQINRKAL